MHLWENPVEGQTDAAGKRGRWCMAASNRCVGRDSAHAVGHQLCAATGRFTHKEQKGNKDLWIQGGWVVDVAGEGKGKSLLVAPLL